jgi:DNA-binding Xre family transcriptional regulator
MVLSRRKLVRLVHLVKEMLAAKDLTLQALTAVVGVAREQLV